MPTFALCTPARNRHPRAGWDPIYFVPPERKWDARLRGHDGMAVLYAFLVLLSSCTHEVELTYNCSPIGATVFEEGVGKVGQCPVILKYNSYDIAVGDDVIYTKRINVVWPSGAELLIPPSVVSLSPEGKGSMLFLRPEDYPDFEKDEKAAQRTESLVLSPGVKYTVSANQDKNLFDTINKGFICTWASITRDVGTVCP